MRCFLISLTNAQLVLVECTSTQNYLVLLKMSSFWTGRIWTANCSFKALFDQEFHILLQALEGEVMRAKKT